MLYGNYMSNCVELGFNLCSCISEKVKMCFKPSGEPHAAYQGSYLVPILVRLYCLASGADETLNMPFQAEALAIPTSARLRRIHEFLRFGHFEHF